MADEMALDNEKESWMNSKWRPMMGWMYMLVCTMDFVVFPILWSLLQTMNHGQVTSQWNPLTLQGAGLFHMAMGAVLGVAAFGRTQEKIAGANFGSTTTTTPSGFGVSASGPTTSSGFSTSGPTSTSSVSSSSVGSVPATTASGKAIVPVGNEPEL